MPYQFYNYTHAAVKKLAHFQWQEQGLVFLKSFHKTQKINTAYMSKLVDLRTECFKLESFGRVIRHSTCAEISQAGLKIRELAKLIEDSLGAFLYYCEVHNQVVLSKNKPALKASYSEVSKAFKKLDGQQSQFFNQIIEIHDLLIFIQEQSQDVRQLYLRAVVDDFKKISRKIKEDIDPSLLEDGTHKLRRLLRWVIMHIVYPQGLFCYNDLPQKPVANFLKLKPHRINQPVGLDYRLMKKISDYVGQLGAVKDKGLYGHYLHELRGESVDINQSNEVTIYITEDIKDDIIKSKTIKKLRKSIQQQI